MNDRQNFEEILKDCALWGGIALALISIYFSYDGLDQTIGTSTVNPEMGWFTVLIGIVMAVIITLLQFIFNSDFSKLSTTLKVIGFVSYFYSIWTNKLGIGHLFGFSEFAAWCVAFAFDVVPEALIAWAWDDDINGDLIGNMFKGFSSLRRGGRSRRNSGHSNQNQSQPKPAQEYPITYRPANQNQPKKGQGRGFWEQELKKSKEAQQHQGHQAPKGDRGNNRSFFE